MDKSRSRPIKKKSKPVTKKISSTCDRDLPKRYHDLKLRDQQLDEQIKELQEKGVSVNLDQHIKALHEYNEMKDLTQVVLGYLADIKQTTLADLHTHYDLPLE